MTAWSSSTPTSWTDRWYHYDRLGNVTARAVSNGATSDEYDQDAFGWVLSGNPSGHHITGKDQDIDVGMHYFNNRWYHGFVRWTQPEPSGADGPNLYWYVFNSPTTAYDPTGLEGIFHKISAYWWNSADVRSPTSSALANLFIHQPLKCKCFDGNPVFEYLKKATNFQTRSGDYIESTAGFVARKSIMSFAAAGSNVLLFLEPRNAHAPAPPNFTVVECTDAQAPNGASEVPGVLLWSFND